VVVAEVEGTETEEGLEDGVPDVGDVVVAEVDGVQLVEFREGVARDARQVVVANVQYLQAGHVLQRDLWGEDIDIYLVQES
jgi:hypothetical protein